MNLLRQLFPLLVVLITACQPDSAVTPFAQWQIPGGLVIDGSLSANGEYAALLYGNNTLAVWNNETQKEVARWPARQLLHKTRFVMLSDEGGFVLTASDSGVQAWNISQAVPIGTLPMASFLDDARITGLAFRQAPGQFVIGTSRGVVLFADINNDSYRVNQAHTAEVTRFHLTQDGLVLFSAGNDGKVIRWDLNNAEPVTSVILPHRITSLAVRNARQVFISDALKTQQVWDSISGDIVGELQYLNRHAWFREAVFVEKANALVTSSPKTEIHRWDLNTMEKTQTWSVRRQSLGSTIEAMVLTSPDTLRTLTSDGVVEDWMLAVPGPLP